MQDPAFGWLQAINRTHQKTPPHIPPNSKLSRTCTKSSGSRTTQKGKGNLPASHGKGVKSETDNLPAPIEAARKSKGRVLGAHLGDGEAGCAEHARPTRVFLSPLPSLGEDSNGLFGKSRICFPRFVLGERINLTAVIGLILWCGAVGRLGGRCVYLVGGEGQGEPKIIGIVGKM
jgi:hypothetical protein